MEALEIKAALEGIKAQVETKTAEQSVEVKSLIEALEAKMESKNNETVEALKADLKAIQDHADLLDVKLQEKTAETNRVTLVIDNVSVDETHLSESLPYGVLNMTLTATGRFDLVMSFLNSLEKLPYYLDFKTVRLVKVGGENNSDWSINVVFSSLTN
jgi:seryl-tRNA synthetase